MFTLIRTGLIAIAIVLFTVGVVAALTNSITYQGRLLDDQGDPIDGSVAMIFSIYDAESGGTLLWTESHGALTASNGLVNLILGQGAPIPDSVFQAADRWLEIDVNDQPISPRTKLTATPYTFSATSVEGDVSTSDSGLVIGNAAKGAHMSLFSRPSGNSFDMNLTELSQSGTFTINDQAGQGGTLFEVSANQADGGSIRLGDPGDQDDALVLSAVYGDGPSIRLGDPGDQDDVLEVSVMAGAGGNIRMFNPQPEPPRTMLSVMADRAMGPSLELFSSFSDNPIYRTAHLRGGDSSAAFVLSRIVDQARTDSAVMTESGVSFYLENEPLTVYGADQAFFQTCDAKSARRMAIGACGMQMDDAYEEGSIDMNDGGFFVDGWATPKAGWEAYLTADSFKFAPGAVAGHIMTSDADGKASWQAPSGGGGGGWTDDGSVVRLTNIGDRVGIGVTNPSENLVVGKDLGSIVDAGNRIVVGDDDVAANTGFVFGEDNNNRGFMYWDVAEDFARLGTKNGGSLYASTLTWNSGKVGIGTEYPSQELHVVGDICYTGSIGSCSDMRYKKDVATIDGASDILMQLRGIRYNWRQGEFPENKFDDERHLGFVAQEVRKLLPEIVMEDDKGYLSVDYSRLTPVLVEALKDMHRDKEDQDKRVARLENELADLKAAVEKMRDQLSR